MSKIVIAFGAFRIVKSVSEFSKLDSSDSKDQLVLGGFAYFC
jgi:hypothetical protein